MIVVDLLGRKSIVITRGNNKAPQYHLVVILNLVQNLYQL